MQNLKAICLDVDCCSFVGPNKTTVDIRALGTTSPHHRPYSSPLSAKIPRDHQCWSL